MRKSLFETNRLWFRQFINEDKIHLFDLNSDEEVIRFTGDSAFASIEQASDFINNYNHYRQYGFGRWAVILKDSNEFIGWCGLKYNPELDEVDLGFRLFKKYWNNGYATEAAQGCINYGFLKLGLTRIVGRAMNENKASIAVLLKLGLRYEKPIDFNGNQGSCYVIHR